MGDPLLGVLVAETAGLGEAGRDRLEAGVGDASEEASPPSRNREVGDVADAAVENRGGRRRGPALPPVRFAGLDVGDPGESTCAARTGTGPGGCSSPGTPPTTWWSSTAWSSGIGTWSCAWNLIAASSSFGSSIAGSLMVRTTIPWLPRPRRTRLESLFFANSSFSDSARASAFLISPSWKAPAVSGSTAAAFTWAGPFTATSVAATLPASMSRPTSALGVFCLVICIGCVCERIASPCPKGIDRKGRGPLPCNY